MFRDVRLGDDIDDYCVRCKRVMNHAVVSVVNGVAAKVRCRTCHNDHDFRHEQPPPPKVDPRKAVFNEVLKTVDPSAAAESDLENEVPDLEGSEGEAALADSAGAGAEADAETAAAKGKAKGAAKTAKVKAKAKK
jgi:hypothetical protein